MKYVAILLFFQATAFSGIVLAADFDTSKVLLNAKMNIVPFNRLFVDSAFIANVIPAKCNFIFLKSNGFKGMVFFKIEINFDSIDQFSELMTKDALLYNYTYYFGYRIIDGDFLLLKGFEKNDFRKLYNWAKTTTPLPEDFETKQGFCNAHFIEGLDIGCLYEYYFLKRKNFKKKLKYDCMKANTRVSISGW